MHNVSTNQVRTEENRTTCSKEATNLGHSTMSVPTGSEQKETGPPVVMNPQTLVTCKMSVPTRSEQKKTELPVVKKLQTLVIVLCRYPLGQNEGNRTTCSNEATNLGYMHNVSTYQVRTEENRTTCSKEATNLGHSAMSVPIGSE